MVPASYRCNNIQQLQAEHFNEYLQQQKLLINHRVSWIDRYIDIQVRSAFSFCHFFSLTIGIIARNKQYNTHIYTHFTIIFAAKRWKHSVLFPSFCPNEPGQHSSQVGSYYNSHTCVVSCALLPSHGSNLCNCSSNIQKSELLVSHTTLLVVVVVLLLFGLYTCILLHTIYFVVGYQNLKGVLLIR